MTANNEPGDEILLTFADLVKKAGTTTAKLAKRFRIPIRTAQHWASGDRTPPQFILLMMDELIDIDKQKKSRD